MKTPLLKKATIGGLMIFVLASLPSKGQEIKDYDGNTYKIVSHGVQTWTASNLNTAHFRNGDPVPQAVSEEEWMKAAKDGKPAWCYYENKEENGRKYGKLYNWYAINDPRGLAPKGWHIPGNADWNVLIKNLFGVDIAGTKLKSKSEWKSNSGTDDIGFAAIPAGYRDKEGKFNDIGFSCSFWSNSVPVEVKPTNNIYTVVLNNNTVEAKFIKSEKGEGFSVRCEKD